MLTISRNADAEGGRHGRTAGHREGHKMGRMSTLTVFYAFLGLNPCTVTSWVWGPPIWQYVLWTIRCVCCKWIVPVCFFSFCQTKCLHGNLHVAAPHWWIIVFYMFTRNFEKQHTSSVKMPACSPSRGRCHVFCELWSLTIIPAGQTVAVPLHFAMALLFFIFFAVKKTKKEKEGKKKEHILCRDAWWFPSCPKPKFQ